MICRHDRLTFVRHNELRDLTAAWLQEVCHDVAVQPLSGESITPNSAFRVVSPDQFTRQRLITPYTDHRSNGQGRRARARDSFTLGRVTTNLCYIVQCVQPCGV